jgi:hypothetical protein
MRPQARTAASRPADGPTLQQILKGRLLVALASRKHGDDRLAASFRAQVQLGREPALGAAQRLVLRLTPR